MNKEDAKAIALAAVSGFGHVNISEEDEVPVEVTDKMLPDICAIPGSTHVRLYHVFDGDLVLTAGKCSGKARDEYFAILDRENAFRLAVTLLNWVEYGTLKIVKNSPDVILAEDIGKET